MSLSADYINSCRVKPGYATVVSTPIPYNTPREYVEEHNTAMIDLTIGQPFTMKFIDQMGTYHEILVTRPMLERIEIIAAPIDHSVSSAITIKGFVINQMSGALPSKDSLVQEDANQTFSNIYNGEEIEGGRR